MTGKLAKETVRASYPKACCRFTWIFRNGAREEFYEIWPNLEVSGHFRGNHYIPAPRLGKGPTKPLAWIAAATKLIDSMATK